MSNALEHLRAEQVEHPKESIPFDIERSHAGNEHELVAAGMQAKLVLAEALSTAPERESEIRELQKKLESLISDAKETLRVLGAAAALGAVLSTGELAEAHPTQGQGEIAEVLSEHADQASLILEGVIEVAGTKSAGEPEKVLAHEAAEVLKELPQQKHPGQKLAMNIAARIAKICLDLAGLGVVSHILDLIEDCTKAFLEKRAHAAT